MEPVPAVEKRSFFGLEILRFLCSASILVWHYQHFFYGPRQQPVPEFEISRQPFFQSLEFFYREGSRAVAVFWMISGFIFCWKYLDAIRLNQVSFRKFAVDRFARLYPLNLLTLLMVVGLGAIFFAQAGYSFVYQGPDAGSFVANLLYVQQWFAIHSLNGPAWSVSIEVIVYVVFFGIALWVRPYFLLAAVLSVTGLGLVWAGYRLDQVSGLLYHLVKTQFVSCLMYFMMGSVIYQLRIKGLQIFSLSVLVVFLVFLATNHLGLFMLAIPAKLILIISVFLLVPDGARIWKSSLAGFFVRLGSLTYSIYLLHFCIQLLIVIAFARLGIDRDIFYSRTAFVAFMLICFGLSYFSFHYFEHPMQNLIRRKFDGTRSKTHV